MSTYLAEDKMDILEQLNVNLTLFIEHFSETSKNYSLLPYPPIYNCDELDGVMAVPLFRYSVISFYSVIFVMSLLGNGLVCYAVLVSQKMKTVTNFFIINLSTNDIILTLFCVPFSASEKFLLQRWPFGNSLCHIVSFVQAVSVYVSAYTLVAISIDRYMAIMWPLRPRMSKGHAKFVIVTIWLTAMVTAVPVFVTTGQTIPNDTFYEFCEFYICGEDWEDPEMKTAYSILVAMLQYGVPLVVLVFTYTSIAIVVWGKQPPGEAENQRDRRMAKSKRKMIKMMVLVVIVYTVCWLPLNIVQIIADWFPNLQQLKWFPVLYFLVHWLAMSHPCYNPVIYCWMNGRFRVSFYGVFRKVPILKHTVKKYDKSNLMSQAVLSDHMSCRHNIRSIRCNTKRAEGDLDELECHRFISSKSARSSHLLSVEHGL